FASGKEARRRRWLAFVLKPLGRLFAKRTPRPKAWPFGLSLMSRIHATFDARAHCPDGRRRPSRADLSVHLPPERQPGAPRGRVRMALPFPRALLAARLFRARHSLRQFSLP